MFGILAALLTVLFVAFKITNVIDWSWWWVWSPIWASVLFYIMFVLGFLSAFGLLSGLTKPKRNLK